MKSNERSCSFARLDICNVSRQAHAFWWSCGCSRNGWVSTEEEARDAIDTHIEHGKRHRFDVPQEWR